MNSRPTFIARTLILTSANTNYNLKALLDADLSATNQEAPSVFREVHISPDRGNTATVLVGDALLSTTTYGKELEVIASEELPSLVFRGMTAQVPFGLLWVRSTGAAQKVNVLVLSN